MEKENIEKLNTLMKKLNYLKSKQDQTCKNFGMVGMGYVINVLNKYEAEIDSLKAENEKLKEHLNNSIIFHCPHFLTDRRGYVSCHAQLEKQNKELKQLVDESIPWVDQYHDELVEIDDDEYDICIDWIERAKEVMK